MFGLDHFGLGVRRRARAVVACCVGLVSVATPGAFAQNGLGDFRQWLPGAFGGVGVDPSAPGGFTIRVDDDGDPLTPPVDYNLGAQAPGLAGATNYFLSPTRRTLYVLDADFSGIDPSRVWFADLDGMGGVDVVHGPYEVRGQFGNASVLGGPFYYESFGGLRTAVLVLGDSSPQGELWAQVFDLNTPGLGGQVRVDLASGWERGWFSPAGEYLVIKNGLSDVDTQNVNYTLINTCGIGGSFGAASDIRVSGLLIPPDPVFTVTRVGGGTIDVVGQIPGQPNAVFSGTLDACDGSVGPVLGACCFGGFCVDGITEIECGDGEFFPGVSCDDACPQPTVELAGGASATVLAGEPLVYTFVVDNTGPVLAENVSVFANAPSGLSIDGVSSGGQISGGTRADWTIASIAPGSSAAVTMTVTAPCTPQQIVLDSAVYGARIGFNIFSGPSITTDVLAPADGDVTVSVQSVPEGSTPAIQGDTALHTVTISNNGPIAANGITLECFNLGNGNELESVIDDGGGQIVQGQCGAGSLTWTGDLPAGATRTLVFRTRLACVSQSFPGGPLGVLLNRGVDLTIRRGEPCEDVIARGTPTRIDAVAPLAAELSYTELTPGTLRLNPVDALFFPPVIGLGRLGEAAEVVLTIRNDAGPDLAQAEFEYFLGDSWEAVGDPFIVPPPSGVSYDAASDRVVYSGPLATGATIEVRMSLVMSSHDRPDDGVVLRSGMGCDVPAFATRDAEIYAVPATPSGTHVHAVSGFDHFRHDAPLGDGFDARLPDFYFELLAGIDAGADNSLYVADLLFSYVLNPDTLYFNVFEDVAFPQDPDPLSGGVLHLNGGDLYRYFADGTRELVYSDPTGQSRITQAAVTDDGVIHLVLEDPVTFANSIVSLDPRGASLPTGPSDLFGALPTPEVTYPYEGEWGPLLSRVITGFADDGTDLLALVQSFYAGPNPGDGGIAYTALVRIDAASRAVTIVEPELGFFRQDGGPPLPNGSQPVFQSLPNGIAAVSRTLGPIFDLNFGRGFAGYDPATRLPVGFIIRGSQSPYADLVLIERGCNGADLNDDGVLDTLDITAFTALFGSGSSRVDYNGDGVFDLGDIGAFIALFTAGCP
jgi:uncharacterized repeat protein (TIGR01451 family)